MLKTKFSSYIKGPEFRERLQEIFGGSIFNSEGQSWYDQRKIAVSMFTSNKFRTYIMEINQLNLEKFRAIISKHLKEGTALDMKQIFLNYTMDMICNTAFGHNPDCLSLGHTDFSDAFDLAQEHCCWRFYQPLWPYSYYLEPGEYRSRRNFSKHVTGYLVPMVKERLAMTQEEVAGKSDVLSMFVQKRDAQGNTVFTGQFLQDVVSGLMVAGRDTTACALAWAVVELAEHPEHIKLLKEELAYVLHTKGETLETLTYDTVKGEMNYFHAVSLEVLRLHPSVTDDVKDVAVGETWPDGTFVPKGSVVNYTICAVCRNKKVWGDDADEFKPSRHLENDHLPYVPKPKRSQYEYPVFNGGPRACVGIELAMLEIKSVLASLVSTADFHLARPQHGVEMGLVKAPKGPLPVTFTPPTKAV